jgi:methyl-accepting chemotaxis protein
VSKAVARNAGILGFVATILLVLIIGVLTWRQFTLARDARIWVEHTYQVIGAAKDLRIAFGETQRNERSYVLLGDQSYLDSYRVAAARIALLQDRLRALTVDNPDEQQRLTALAQLIRTRSGLDDNVVALRRDRGFDAAVAAIRADHTRHLISQIAANLDVVIATEQLLLRQRQRAAGREDRLTR